MTRPSFKAQMLQAREDAIVAAAERLLAGKGYDAMTVDAVAAEVGIAKASLYKHFGSKEALAAAAIVGVLDRALAEVERLAHDAAFATDFDRLQALAAWALRAQLAGGLPPVRHAALLANPACAAQLAQLRDQLVAWIAAAQQAGRLDAALPADIVLHTLVALACGPAAVLLRAGGAYSDDEIVAWLLRTGFDGLAARTSPR